jgi:hypothetical protein
LHFVVLVSAGYGQNGGGLAVLDRSPAVEDAGGIVLDAVLD